MDLFTPPAEGTKTERNWNPPSTFPDLSGAKGISIDLETRDDDLEERGPGVRRGAYILGVAVATDDGFAGYFPIGHDHGPNLNREAVLRWLRRELSRPEQTKFGANILYDLDFLAEVGVEVAGKKLIDVQIAEALIDEHTESYTLDSIAKRHLKRGKASGGIEAVCGDMGLQGDPRKHLWRLPARLVGPYAEEDARLPIEIYRKQKVLLKRDDLMEVFRMETYLIPLLLKMRRTGVRIDTKRLGEVIDGCEDELAKKRLEVNRVAGMEVNHNASDSIAKACDRLGIPYGRTAKTRRPSFTQVFLEQMDHPLGKAILDCRKLDKFIGTFLKGSISKYVIDDRLHYELHQLRHDEGGTISGRFSASHPNPQQMPNRDPRLGPLCRSLFIPEEGCDWAKLDYSQVEYRLLAHYASGGGADEFREKWSEPSFDIHQWCADRAGVTRSEAKTLNFGIIFGMGQALLAEILNLHPSDAQAFLKGYHRRFPFVRHTSSKVTAVAENRGYVKTVLGRRRRYPYWIPVDDVLAKRCGRSRDRLELARKIEMDPSGAKTTRIHRMNAHKATNGIIQGSAADLIKKAMVDCHHAGIFDTLVPHIQMHDELDDSVPRTREGREALEESKNLMERAIRFRVPIVVEAKIGPSWGETKKEG